MDLQSFKASVANPQPPEGLALAVQALWWLAKGDWDKAHECAQAQDDKIGAWVHAHLHRQEGDNANAGYWYRRAEKPPATASLEEEWAAISIALLAAG